MARHGLFKKYDPATGEYTIIIYDDELDALITRVISGTSYIGSPGWLTTWGTFIA